MKNFRREKGLKGSNMRFATEHPMGCSVLKAELAFKPFSLLKKVKGLALMFVHKNSTLLLFTNLKKENYQ